MAPHTAGRRVGHRHGLGQNPEKTAGADRQCVWFYWQTGIYNAYRKQCEFMLEDGAWPEEVDSALQAFWFGHGAVLPWPTCPGWTLPGVCARHRPPAVTRVSATWPSSTSCVNRVGWGAKPARVITATARAGRSKPPMPWCATSLPRPPHNAASPGTPLTAADIQRRALLAMVNEAALLLAEGVASRASDIDVVLGPGLWLSALGRWPGVLGPPARPHRTGTRPAHHGRQSGHGFVVADLSVLLD